MEHIILPTFGLEIHTVLMLYIIVILWIFSYIFSRRVKLIPGGGQIIIEMIIVALNDLAEETMGPKGRKYIPFIITIFLYILVANTLGLIPGLAPPTANLNSTVGLALAVFFTTHVIGIREHGLKYLKQFAGPMWWLIPLFLPLEIISHLARPLSLSLRLFGNMMGHERIVMVLLVLMPLALPMLSFVTLLGILVVFLQAFIFTLLAMMYIGGALEEAH